MFVIDPTQNQFHRLELMKRNAENTENLILEKFLEIGKEYCLAFYYSSNLILQLKMALEKLSKRFASRKIDIVGSNFSAQTVLYLNRQSAEILKNI